MFGQRETSLLPRLVWAVIHAGLVVLAGWIYFGRGRPRAIAGSGRQAGGLPRRAALFSCGIVVFLRMTFTAFYLLKRRFGWAEAVPVLLASGVYQVGFALLGFRQRKPLGGVDAVGGLLFAVGSAMNTGSELQRKRFKDAPGNQGRLYTQGLFGISRHPNYLGDTLWVTGWAILTRNRWAALVPILLAISFVTYLIPELDGYLKQKYGDAYDEWASKTKSYVPFVL